MRKKPVKRTRKIRVINADNRVAIKKLADNSVDSIVTDPPYALVSVVKRFGKRNAAPAKGNQAFVRASRGFMGQTWDTAEVTNDVTFWAECLRVLKPGGHLLSFGGTRTYHRMVCAIEDAGFEIRDMIQWLYGSGFPKSHDVSKGIDKAAGKKRILTRKGQTKSTNLAGKFDLASSKSRQRRDIPATSAAKKYQGWGTALKPANEPIMLARKPLSEKTVAANVLKWGTGAINVDGCRVEADDQTKLAANWNRKTINDMRGGNYGKGIPSGIKLSTKSGIGRFPANVITDGSDEVVAMFPRSKDGVATNRGTRKPSTVNYANHNKDDIGYGGEGSAARFFYQASWSDKEWLAQNLNLSAANIAKSNSYRSKGLVVSALNSAATSVLPVALRCVVNFPPHFMNATAS